MTDRIGTIGTASAALVIFMAAGCGEAPSETSGTSSGEAPAADAGSQTVAESASALPPIGEAEFYYIFKPEDIQRARDMVESGVPELVEARDAIVAEAERILEKPIVTVVDGKEPGPRMAPSGDPHDYVSLSPYWWPDPEKEDGLPYIRRDGEINPERANYDVNKLGDFGNFVHALAMGYSVSGDERFAERAAEHLRAWFVNPDTRMNPRIQYGQFVPGRAEGRSVGIIETNRIRFVADSIGMIRASDAWSEEDDAAAREWYGQYLEWMLTSELGHGERTAPNNHGTWFATQAAQYALVSGRPEVTREMAESGKGRVQTQIEPDGSQPHELERTKALDYTCFNLRALIDLGTYGQKVGVDLLNYETEDGRSIEKGIAFALPYATEREEWPWEQIETTRYNMYNQLFRMGELRLGREDFGDAVRELPELEQKDQWMAYFWPLDPRED